MISDLSLSIKTARRRAGLNHRDCGHLMGLDKTGISDIETGKRALSARQICELAIILNKPLDELLGEELVDACADIHARLSTLPRRKTNLCSGKNRQHTLNELAERINNVVTYGS